MCVALSDRGCHRVVIGPVKFAAVADFSQERGLYSFGCKNLSKKLAVPLCTEIDIPRAQERIHVEIPNVAPRSWFPRGAWERVGLLYPCFVVTNTLQSP